MTTGRHVVAAMTFLGAAFGWAPAEAETGTELLATFRTHCLEPFPSLEAIAARAADARYNAHPLPAEEVLGDSPTAAQEGAIKSFDGRAFWQEPGRSEALTMISVIAFSFDRAAPRERVMRSSACALSGTKSNEGASALRSHVADIALALEARFGGSFEADEHVFRQIGELSAGDVTWQRSDMPEDDDGGSVTARIQYVEVEPAPSRADDSSSWSLSVTALEERP